VAAALSCNVNSDLTRQQSRPAGTEAPYQGRLYSHTRAISSDVNL